MNKLVSTKYSAGAFSTAVFILRIIVGALMLNHGYSKLIHFADMQPKFMNFLGLGSTVSLSMVIFAEFFCAGLVILGLFTRLACIPILILFVVIIFKSTNADFFGKSELPVAYLTGFLAILFAGAGRISVYSMISK